MIDLNKLDITGDFIFNSLDILNFLGLFLMGFLFYKNVIKTVIKEDYTKCGNHQLGCDCTNWDS